MVTLTWWILSSYTCSMLKVMLLFFQTLVLELWLYLCSSGWNKEWSECKCSNLMQKSDQQSDNNSHDPTLLHYITCLVLIERPPRGRNHILYIIIKKWIIWFAETLDVDSNLLPCLSCYLESLYLYMVGCSCYFVHPFCISQTCNLKQKVRSKNFYMQLKNHSAGLWIDS